MLRRADRVSAAAGQQYQWAATGQPLDPPAAAQPALDDSGDLGVPCSSLGLDHHSELMGCVDGHRHLVLEAERACATRQ
jgi:hypothetical protein